MSLMKAREFDRLNYSFNDLELSFQDVLDDIKENDLLSLKRLIDIYSIYSCLYLREVSLELAVPLGGRKDTLSIMNSFIIELSRKFGVRYLDSNGKSIIDNTVNYVLDNGIQFQLSYIDDIISKMEESLEQEETDDSIN